MSVKLSLFFTTKTNHMYTLITRKSRSLNVHTGTIGDLLTAPLQSVFATIYQEGVQMAYEEAYLAGREKSNFVVSISVFPTISPTSPSYGPQVSLTRAPSLKSKPIFCCSRLEKLMIFHHCVYCMECKNNPERLLKSSFTRGFGICNFNC